MLYHPLTHPLVLQDLELKEFCALESEVLREISNCAPAPASAVSPGKPAPSPRPAHSGAAIRGSVAHSWQPQQQDWGRELQHGTEDEGEEVEDAFQSDDEGAVCSIFGHGPQQLPPPQGSRAAGRPAVSFAAQPAVVVEEEEEAELFAQVWRGLGFGTGQGGEMCRQACTAWPCLLMHWRLQQA